MGFAVMGIFCLLTQVLATDITQDAVCMDDDSMLDGVTQSDTLADVRLLQTDVQHVKKAATRLKVGSHQRPECVAWNMSSLIHNESRASTVYRHVFEDPTLTPDFKVMKKYAASTVEGDSDQMWWWMKDGDCWFVLQGMDDMSPGGGDYANMVNFTTIERWGVSGLHSGVANELELLLNEVDFAEVGEKCKGTFTVAGFSMGGGTAQLLSLLLNKDGDPLAAKLRVDYLYTFGGIGMAHEPGSNDKASNGCFAGAQYWYAQPAPDGSTNAYAVDNLVYDRQFGGEYEPVRSKHLLVFIDGSGETFACGTPMPECDDLMSAVGMEEWAGRHSGYGRHLGCVR